MEDFDIKQETEFNDQNKININEIHTFIDLDSENLFQIDIIRKNTLISINCINTYTDNNKTYSLELTNGLILQYFSCSNIQFMNKLNIDPNKKLKLESDNNGLLLYISLADNLKQKLKLKCEGEKKEKKEEIHEKNIDKLNEQILIEELKEAESAIKILMEENKKLKEEIKKLKETNNNFENKIKLSFMYNSLDFNAYKINDIFLNLNTKNILQNENELVLINKGMKYLFEKNIIYFDCIYQLKDLEFVKEEFQEIFDNCPYGIILIMTKDNKRFGTFFNAQKLESTSRAYDDFGSQKKLIFDASANTLNYFIFSFEDRKIYHSVDKNVMPNFTIFYDLKRQTLFGEESEMNFSFMLNGKKEFNIKYLELYKIEVGYL